MTRAGLAAFSRERAHLALRPGIHETLGEAAELGKIRTAPACGDFGLAAGTVKDADDGLSLVRL